MFAVIMEGYDASAEIICVFTDEVQAGMARDLLNEFYNSYQGNACFFVQKLPSPDVYKDDRFPLLQELLGHLASR